MKEKIEWIKQHPPFLRSHLGLLALLCVMCLWNWWVNGKMIEDFLEDVLVGMVPFFIFAVVLNIVFYKAQKLFLPLLQMALVFVGFPVFLFFPGFMVSAGLYVKSDLSGDLSFTIGLAVSLLINFVFSLWLSRKVEAGLLAREAARQAQEEENQNGQT